MEKYGDRRDEPHFLSQAGGPPSTICACTIPAEGAPPFAMFEGWVPPTMVSGLTGQFLNLHGDSRRRRWRM